MLETLDDPTIHRMVLEEPEKNSTGWFDVESEISASERDELLNALRTSRVVKNWQEFAGLATDLLELGIDPGVTERDQASIAAELDFNGGTWLAYTLFLFQAVRLGAIEILNKAERVRVAGYLQEFANKKIWGSYLEAACAMKFLEIDFELPADHLKSIYSELEDRRNDNMIIFTFMAANLKELGQKVDIDENDRENMRKTLNQLRGGEASEFALMAVNMKKLSDSREKNSNNH